MKTREDKITQVIAHAVCLFFTVCAIAPLILLVIGSFTEERWAITYGYSFLPGEFSLAAYKYIAAQWATIGRAYLMTIIVTVAGTAVGVIISSLYAYALRHRNVPGMKFFSFLLIFTMLFNGGLVSTYYCYVRLYGMKDTIWAQIIPALLMNAFEVILIRNYYATSIPDSLLEAAKLDGAGEFQVLNRIVMPLSKPILATVGMMKALTYWNNWTNGFYFLSKRNGAKFYTIQNILNNINENIEAMRQAISNKMLVGMSILEMPSNTVRMAIAVVGVLPILIAYPFFQKYFVKGITLGGVKG